MNRRSAAPELKISSRIFGMGRRKSLPCVRGNTFVVQEDSYKPQRNRFQKTKNLERTYLHEEVENMPADNTHQFADHTIQLGRKDIKGILRLVGSRVD